tara:strand:- start:953 stop:1654 length:702 start_codon:yes stop_codon:yes gene_type:complete
MKLLTIIIPAYNETRTISKLLTKIFNLNIKKQVIVIDDNSSDDTKDKILKFKKKIDKIIFHKKNLGKGSAIKSAQKFVKGDYVIIQDADLEYNPKDILIMLKKIETNNKIDVLYGSRVLKKKRYQSKDFLSLDRVFFNHVLTIFSNLINFQNLSDAHTCYKLVRTKIFKKIKLEEKKFSFCPELTTKLSNMGYKIIEVPISYKGRSFEEGKKIRYTDGIDAIKTLIKYKFFSK